MLKIEIIGNLTRDPEMRTTGNGMDVCNFTVASSRKVNGEDKTDYVRVAVFGKRAAPCVTYLAKGRKVYVCGIPSASSYTNRSGETVVQLDVIANEIEFLSSKGEEPATPAAPAPSAPASAPQTGYTEIEDDELPF